MFKSRYIQANGPTHKYWLVFDVDKPNASLDWYDSGAPAPNIVATNRENGHAHLIYGLEVSIRTAPDGRSAPLRYAAAVENALREKLGADKGGGRPSKAKEYLQAVLELKSTRLFKP